MDKPKQTLVGAMLAVALHVFVVPVLIWGLMIGFLIAPAVFAFPSGIIFIWLVVRFVNRRDDPMSRVVPAMPPIDCD